MRVSFRVSSLGAMPPTLGVAVERANGVFSLWGKGDGRPESLVYSVLAVQVHSEIYIGFPQMRAEFLWNMCMYKCQLDSRTDIVCVLWASGLATKQCQGHCRLH